MDEHREFQRPDDAELRRRLSPRQYAVACNEDTEPPFRNALWDNHARGLYVDVVSGEPLFSSEDKYDSGTGWPSFTRPVESGRVVERPDDRLGTSRTEIRSAHGDAHLGHVFPDGPGPAGLRYCVNSASLRFIPVERLEQEGYGRYVPLFAEKPARATDDNSAAAKPAAEVATLAGGCFWGMEEILRGIPGVLSTRVGYTGGHVENPRYEDTHDGGSGHAEAVEVRFDPSKLSFEELLEKWYFRMHDPTTRDRQGNDRGSQYRSAIFFHGEKQRRKAEEVRGRVERSGRWKRPIVTQIVPAGVLWPAEEHHQKYLQKHPGGYTCHYVRD